jgi:hypothetical protein
MTFASTGLSSAVSNQPDVFQLLTTVCIKVDAETIQQQNLDALGPRGSYHEYMSLEMLYEMGGEIMQYSTAASVSRNKN